MELKIREEIGDKNAIAHCLQGIGSTYDALKNRPEALKYYLDALKLSEQNKDKFFVGVISYCLGDIYLREGRYKEALEKDSSALKLLLENGNEDGIASAYETIGRFYEKQGDLASAQMNQALELNQYTHAINNYTEALLIWQKQDRKGIIAEQDIALGGIYVKIRQHNKAKKYLEEGLSLALTDDNNDLLKDAYLGVSRLDSSLGNYKQAYNNYKMYVIYLESLKTDENARNGESYRMQFEYDKKEAVVKAAQELKDARTMRTRNLQYVIIAAVLVIAIFLYLNSRQKQKAKTKIEKAYGELKATQQQLIQSEKMASLGELTAGIAHEIQNPLNFVNNFSEVNKELVDELQQELRDGKIDDAISISNDIKENEEKINHHGKRADAIVKGMLQHSRSSAGAKEPVDINKLADEYLRLAYHGLRAKDKSFSATLKTDYDESVGNITVIPQDIGRVILNLVNNAFYAVAEKKKQNPALYEPTVSVGTKKINGKVEIKVNDNGNGIPQKVLDKIFQPFFTTKPTGQGTGLGLSLAYDIVKAHGGDLKVETKEGEGSEFIISLPVV
ncbi:MAG: hypothetical protein E6H09_23340 [Bacteroidetes bacterium]|nr:MAG: hypothetical protein E6H09_23340 [Bacteroidota bacterium]